jgi:hypothetical protein
MRPATSPNLPTRSSERFARNSAQPDVAHHKATVRLVGLTALLAVGLAGMTLLALQHAWLLAAAFAVIVLPLSILGLAAATRETRHRFSRRSVP